MKCETIANDCFSQPCFNNGRCSYSGLCSCPDVTERCGWQNRTCQTDVCSNRASCFVLATSFTCDCLGTGFAGPQCTDDMDECTLANPCANGGICANTLGSFSCACSGTGFRGERCEEDIDECNVTSVCFNGGEYTI